MPKSFSDLDQLAIVGEMEQNQATVQWERRQDFRNLPRLGLPSAQK